MRDHVCLEGKRIIITGASRGIGRAIAIACAEQGALVGVHFKRSQDEARGVAVEYGRKGIRCHCISPGPVDTDMFAATTALAGDDVLDRIPLKRFVQPEEIAELAVLLLSARASAITSAIHVVDGG